MVLKDFHMAKMPTNWHDMIPSFHGLIDIVSPCSNNKDCAQHPLSNAQAYVSSATAAKEKDTILYRPENFKKLAQGRGCGILVRALP